MIHYLNCTLIFLCVSEFVNDDYIEQIIISKLKHFGNKITYKKNSLIFMQGAIGKFLHILEKGKVKIVLNSSRQQVISVKDDNSIFGCIVIFNINPLYPASAYTKEDSTVIRIDRKEAENYIIQDPTLIKFWSRFITKKAYNFSQILSNINLNDAIGKVCYFLLECVKKSHYARECDGYVVDCISQSAISEQTGIRRETVSRIFNKLTSLKILTVCNNKIIINDLEKLKLFIS